MKAVILAGDEGRLQSVHEGRPDAMVHVLGRPVLEHTLHLLRRHGVTEIRIAAGACGERLRAYFGDGSRFGVRLSWTQSGRAAWPGETVLVMGGTMLTDMDLTALMREHAQRGGAATLAVYAHPRPQDRTLVLADPQGLVTRLVDKPGWDGVVSDRASTGVCVLDGRLAEEGEPVRDLLDRLVAREERVYAVPVPGYWRDIGDHADYLDCCADALSGKVKLDMGLDEISPGVWSDAPLPGGVEVIPPCWIGRAVSLGEGTLIGPHVVLERGSRVGQRSLVQRSVLLGAQVGDRATLYGAVLCERARVGDEAVLNEGVVLGENAWVQDRAVLMEKVRLWPGRVAAEGCRLNWSVTGTGRSAGLAFGDGGVIRGVLGEDIGPEQLLLLGGALSTQSKVGLGCWGGPGAQMLLRSAVSGVTAGGGTALCHDMECPAQAAWLAEHCQLPASLFIQQDGPRIYLHLFDDTGLALSRRRQRRLEQAMLRGPVCQYSPGRVGSCEHISAGPRDYARDAARRSALSRGQHRLPRVAVEGNDPAARALRSVLEELGCVVVEQWRRGIPAFRADYGGLRLSARDESGVLLSPRQLLAMAVLVELEHGSGCAAVPEDAGVAAELIARGCGKPVLRLGRDGERAVELYRTQPWFRDAAFAAARLCSRMARTGERLEQLAAKTPRLCAWRREVSVSRGRGELMRLLAQRAGTECESGSGLRLRTGGGWVYLTPLARRRAVRVVAESADMEIAAELCDLYADKIRRLDGEDRTK